MKSTPLTSAIHYPNGTSAESVNLVEEGSLPAAWYSRWRENPTAPVVFTDEAGRVSAEQLEHLSATRAQVFHHAGLQRGQRILMSASTSLDLVVSHVAALRLGAIVVPANTAFTAREIAHIVSDSSPAMAIVDQPAMADTIRELSPAIVVSTPTWDLPDEAIANEVLLDQSTPTDPAMLAYTSGTTGSPKGALLSHGNLLASAEALRLAWRWTPEDRLVLPLPLFHMHGLGVGLHGTLLSGASVVLQEGFNVSRVLDAIHAHKATLFFGVPTLWSRLLSSGRIGELRSLRLAVSGSAPLDPTTHGEIALQSGQRIIERYGMTETIMLTSNPYDGERRAGTVGVALPQVDLRLDNETSEIFVKGPNVFSGYWQREDATSESLEGGWFATGDVGEFDEAGYLRIVGRRKDLIISGGYNVYPREIEDLLRTHESVHDIAVVGQPHPDWGEAVIAVVEGDPTSEAELASVASRQLAPYKRPKRYVFVDALPRNALGKVVKAQLSEVIGP